jgi:hypothetical protein
MPYAVIAGAGVISINIFICAQSEDIPIAIHPVSYYADFRGIFLLQVVDLRSEIARHI